MATPRVASNRSSAVTLLIAGSCIFVTGLVALVYEICWIRKASLAFGSATWALSAVLAVFFSGLALGSFVVGVYSSRTVRPLRVYAWLEMGVGLSAILSPTLFQLTDSIYGSLYPHVLHSPALLTLTRLVMVTIVILPATTFMGGSLPLFCRQYVLQPQRISRGVGLLYGLNTLGAAVGSAVCGFWLIPRIGVDLSIYLAGGLNLLVGLIALRLAQGSDLAIEKPADDLDESPRDLDPSASQQAAPAILAWLFFGVGFVALAHEVLWTRYLSLWMPNTVSTYTLTLTVVLLGIVLGSLLSAVVSDRLRWRRSFRRGTGCQRTGRHGGDATAASLVGRLAEPRFGRPAVGRDHVGDARTGDSLRTIVSAGSPPDRPRRFPDGLRCREDGGDQHDRRDRRFARRRIRGIAPVGVADHLVPNHGNEPVDWHRGLVHVEIGSLLAIATGLTAVSVLLWAAIPYYCRTQLPQDFLATEGTLVDFREGIGANVSVVRKGDLLQLEINRMWQGQNRKNHQVMAAHIPALLHRDPKSVLVIGLGTGQTARSFLLHDIDRLDCVEIEDGLVDLVEQYFNSVWMNDPRVHLIVEDGRNYVTHTSDQYDLISIEVGQIYRPRVASFYTADFYQRIRSRLRPGIGVPVFAD